MDKRTCTYCTAEITEGRRDKKFCNAHCRSAFQYAQNLKKEPVYQQVNKALRTNRKIMKKYNLAGFASTRADALIAQGFNPRFTTHSWKNRKGEEYKFVFEFGFLETQSTGGIKYKLIMWQDYMNQKAPSERI